MREAADLSLVIRAGGGILKVANGSSINMEEDHLLAGKAMDLQCISLQATETLCCTEQIILHHEEVLKVVQDHLRI
jgi:hypothetical protein